MSSMTKRTCVLAAVAAGLAATAGSADAALTVGLRGVGGGNSVQATSVGQAITLELFATVTGTDANPANESLTSLFGSLVSNPGGVVGNFSTFTPGPLFEQFQPGVVRDINGRPGLDLGAANGGTGTDFLQARSGAPETSTSSGVQSLSNGIGVVVGTVTFTVTEIGSGGATTLDFVPRLNATGGPVATAAVFAEDGVTKGPTSGTFVASSTPFTVVPEPATLGVLGMAGLALLGRRRRAAAH